MTKLHNLASWAAATRLRYVITMAVLLSTGMLTWQNSLLWPFAIPAMAIGSLMNIKRVALIDMTNQAAIYASVAYCTYVGLSCVTPMLAGSGLTKGWLIDAVGIAYVMTSGLALSALAILGLRQGPARPKLMRSV